MSATAIVTVSDNVRTIMSMCGLNGKQKAIADHMGIGVQAFRNKLTRNSWSVEDLILIVDFCKCDFTVSAPSGGKVVFSIDNISSSDNTDGQDKGK